MASVPASASPTGVWTVKDLLNWTTDYLVRKGATLREARLEAQILLAHVMGCPKIELVARSDETPEPPQRSRFKELIQRRLDGWPVAYLVGKRDFYLLSFEVSPAVLIPRPDTETLVLEALKRMKSFPSARVLDLGTGSGCIAISLAHQAKQARVTAVDLSPDALEVARRNAVVHGVADRVRFLQGDLFQPLAEGEQFDLIVSNPPYVTAQEMAELAPEVREHEPRLALEGGSDGLAFYRRILAQAGQFLKPNGWLMLEIGSRQAEPVKALFAAAGWQPPTLYKDPAGNDRLLAGQFNT